MATDFTGTAPITGGGQVFVKNSLGEWEVANVTSPGFVRTVYTSGTAATHTWAPGAIAAKVFVTAGGAGGGGADCSDSSAGCAGGGGQAGGTAIKFYTSAEMGATATYTVGTGGAGGSSTGGAGTDGTDSTFDPAGTGATLTAEGGDGGDGDTGTGDISWAQGGSSEGGASGGDLNMEGGDGEPAYIDQDAGSNTPGGRSGGGGGSYWGGGARGLVSNAVAGASSTAGFSGGAYGTGGGGAIALDTTSGAAGGAGADGVIVIEEYIRQSVLSPIAYNADGTALLDLSTDGQVNPGANDDASLGASGTAWSDLFLASGGVINFNSGNVTLTHATGELQLIGNLVPGTSDTYDLGAPGDNWQQIFLSNTGEIRWNNGSHIIEQETQLLTLAADDSNAVASSAVRFRVDGSEVCRVTATGLSFDTGTNNLDDYEEGTWTPTLTTDGVDFSSITYDGLRGGKYTKIGRVVHVEARIRTDAITVGSASGNVIISGLPFTANSSCNAGFAIASVANWTGEQPMHIAPEFSDTFARLSYRASATAASSSTQVADVGTGTNDNDIRFSGFYQV